MTGESCKSTDFDSKSGVGLSFSISDKFPSDAVIAGPGTTFWVARSWDKRLCYCGLDLMTRSVNYKRLYPGQGWSLYKNVWGHGSHCHSHCTHFGIITIIAILCWGSQPGQNAGKHQKFTRGANKKEDIFVGRYQQIPENLITAPWGWVRKAVSRSLLPSAHLLIQLCAHQDHPSVVA